MTVTGPAIQDHLVGNLCWGCGAENPTGLHLKSHWDGEVAVSRWMPLPDHAAGPPQYVNGGIMATVLDCHGICTALADAYAREERPIGSSPDLWYATASIAVEYLRPAPIAAALELEGRVTEVDGRRTTVACVLTAAGRERARAEVRAVRVPDEWRHGGAG